MFFVIDLFISSKFQCYHFNVIHHVHSKVKVIEGLVPRIKGLRSGRISERWNLVFGL